MFFKDHFDYRRYAREIHRERIKLEQTAYRGFSSIAIIDVITILSAASRFARAMFPVEPPRSFQRGGIMSGLPGSEPIITKRHNP